MTEVAVGVASPCGLDKSRLPPLFPVWGSGVEIHSGAHTRNLGGHLFPHSLHLVRPQSLISTSFDHDPLVTNVFYLVVQNK